MWKTEDMEKAGNERSQVIPIQGWWSPEWIRVCKRQSITDVLPAASRRADLLWPKPPYPRLCTDAHIWWESEGVMCATPSSSFIRHSTMKHSRPNAGPLRHASLKPFLPLYSSDHTPAPTHFPFQNCYNITKITLMGECATSSAFILVWGDK